MGQKIDMWTKTHSEKKNLMKINKKEEEQYKRTISEKKESLIVTF